MMDQVVEKMEKTELLEKTDLVEKTILDQQRCKNCGGKSHQTELCPHKNKGTRCFRCNAFGHIGKYCEEYGDPANKNEPEQTSDTDQVESDQSMGKILHTSSWKLKFLHGKVEVKTIMCMGILESFIKQSCISKFDCLPEQNRTMKVVKLHGQPVKTMGSYDLYMTNGKEGHYMQCHVVRDDELQEDMLLGMNFIRTVDINIRKGKLTINRAKIKSDEDSTDTDSEDNTTVRESMWWKKEDHI